MAVGERVPETVFSDEKRFKQILFNLVGNAAKFTYTGSITINVDYFESKLHVNVADTGLGITKDDLSRLFHFFGQVAETKNINQSGMGLGLTISKMIVEQLGGAIEVKSIPKKGSTFSFFFPLYEETGSLQMNQSAA
jgi:signal transduction histidine kinase